MKKVVGIMFFLILPEMAFCESYIGLGAGSSNGDDWSGDSLEITLGKSYQSGFVIEGAFYDLGSRKSWRGESAQGISIDLGYKLDKGPLELGVVP